VYIDFRRKEICKLCILGEMPGVGDGGFAGVGVRFRPSSLYVKSSCAPE